MPTTNNGGNTNDNLRMLSPYMLGGCLLLFLFIISRYNYLVFHTLAEFFSISVAFSVFLIVWNTHETIKNDALVFLGIAYLFVGFLDLFHTISYKGIGIIGAGDDANPATQLWIAARYIESVSLLLFSLLAGKKLKNYYALAGYSIVTGLILFAVFFWRIFPVCFVEGEGLTLFKKSSEYLICTLLITTLSILFKNKHQLHQVVYKYLFLSIMFTILGELTFTLYVDVYGILNLIGHFFKIISFYLIYKAIIHKGLKEPYSLIFKKIADNERRYRQVFETNKAVKLIIDPLNGSIVEANNAACKFYGYTKDYLESLKISDINSLETDAVSEKMKKAVAKKETVFNFPHRLASGEIRDVEVYSGPIEYDNHTYLYSIIHDVTEQKLAQDTLKQKEKTAQALLNASKESIFLIDPDGIVLSANKVSASRLGKTEESIKGESVYDLMPLELVKSRKEKIDSVVQTGKSIDFVDERAGMILDNSLHPVFDAQGNVVFVAVFSHDITKEKAADAALTESESKFKKMFERAPLSYQSLDEEGNFIEVNATWLDLMGYKKHEVLGKNFSEFLHPDWKNHFKENFPRFKTVGEVLGVEFQMVKKDGALILVSFHGKIGKNEKGMFQQTHCIFQDITTNRMIQEESERNKTILLEAEKLAGCGGWYWEIGTDTWIMSETWLNIHGLSTPYMKTDALLKIVHPEDLPRVQKAFDDVVNKQANYDIEHRIIDQRSGEIKHIHAMGEARFNEGGQVSKVYGAAQDITQRKKLEKSVLQAQKMESIGNLAGGIAHDFNNILFPIMGLSEMLMADFPRESNEHGNAREIFIAGKRGSELVKQILSFSRQNEHEVLPVKFQKVLKEAVKLLRATIPVNIDIRDSIQLDCGLISADPTQLHQVAMNLITNAYHAVDDADGKIEIALEEVDLEKNYRENGPLAPGRYALFTVSDNGKGIPPDLIDKVFEPYFTTKEKGRGTGLGLAVVFGIIKEHMGDIDVRSEVGKGTRFRVYLPLMKEPEYRSSVNETKELHRGSERILVVDDDKAVVQLEAQMLSRLGYQVTFQVDGFQALKMFQESPNAYDLVITDMTMPNMTGDVLAQKLLAVRSDIPIIICTGFSERMNKEQAENAGIKGFLMKPVSMSQLSLTVRKILDDYCNHHGRTGI